MHLAFCANLVAHDVVAVKARSGYFMTETIRIKERPRSPHISIYRWTITMAMSIAHRLTGMALYFGMVFLTVWLLAIACGAETFRVIHEIYSSMPGLCILFLYTLAGVHHMVGGLRHIIWDLKPSLLAKEKASMVAWATVFISLIMTLVIWLIGYSIV